MSATVGKTSTLRYVNDLNKVSSCSKYYGKVETKKAINKLCEWYIDQQFDDDDFINDWIPGDYDNCDGIYIFVNNLNHSQQANNDSNKRILFDWFCYWLLSDKMCMNEPKEIPISSYVPNQTVSDHTEIENIAFEIKDLLCMQFPNDFNQTTAEQDISDFIINLCKEKGVKYDVYFSFYA